MKIRAERFIAGGFLIFVLLLGCMINNTPGHRTQANEVTYRESAFSSAEIRAEGAMLRGDYRQVDALLYGKVLSQHATLLLTRAELASGDNIKAGILVGRNQANPETAVLTGMLLANKGYYQSAREWLSTCLANGVANKPNLELALSRVLIKMGQVEESGQILQGLDESQLEVLAARGDLALAQGNFLKAWEVYSGLRDKGYFNADNLFLAKLALAALETDRDWAAVTAQMRQNQLYTGLADYLEAEASLRKGDLGTAHTSLQAALDHTVPEGLRPEILIQRDEINARMAAEPAIQAVIARGGH